MIKFTVSIEEILSNSLTEQLALLPVEIKNGNGEKSRFHTENINHSLTEHLALVLVGIFNGNGKLSVSIQETLGIH